jgi:hypothetical protein
MREEILRATNNNVSRVHNWKIFCNYNICSVHCYYYYTCYLDVVVMTGFRRTWMFISYYERLNKTRWDSCSWEAFCCSVNRNLIQRSAQVRPLCRLAATNISRVTALYNLCTQYRVVTLHQPSRISRFVYNDKQTTIREQFKLLSQKNQPSNAVYRWKRGLIKPVISSYVQSLERNFSVPTHSESVQCYISLLT